MQIILTVVAIIFLVVLAICMWKTGEYFNTLPESNKYKSVLAWDLLILFFVAIALIMRIVSM